MFTSQADRKLLQLAAGRLGLEGPSIEVLSGGSRNRCYAIGDAGRSVIVRIAGAHDEEFAVARAAESLAQRTAAAAGLAPAILLEEPERGLLVMERVAGEPWTRGLARSPDGAAGLGGWLARLHRLPVPLALRRVDFVASLEHYVAALGPSAVPPSVIEQARVVAARLAGQTRRVLCHNDLHHLNILGPPAQIVVIDWEYAGLGEAIMDLAGFVAYHELSEPLQQRLLVGYTRHGQPSPSLPLLADARWLFESVWWAWLALKSRLDGDEAPAICATRQRLAARLGLPAGAH
jgi:aminoglycoside phosphotransferase (APT) family kinase protein